MARFLCPSGNHEYQLGLGQNTPDHSENEVKPRECGEEHVVYVAPPPVVEEVKAEAPAQSGAPKGKGKTSARR